ncbi:MAG: sugar ABC transporter permease [Solobacterium sp.]|nr:sugar ABC transporter permease [Solobacterium sp.]MBQ1355740.1 sugar ABC transporter permease [Solobacterium sp.]MBQ3272897.1 sugar ABC transporter permease [Solobacterium sp.]MBQ6356022.1 sugar ABC transporter permease [Solobacterium sp.]
MQKTEKLPKTKSISYSRWGYIFIAPFFIIYTIFTFYPQLLTVYNSFFEYYRDGLTIIGPRFVGLQNYKTLFSLNTSGYVPIFKFMGNTLWLWIIGALPQFTIAMLLALFFTSTRLDIKGQQFFKTVIYMPNLIMASAFSMLFFALFSQVGPVNQLLVSSGMALKPINFLGMRVTVQSLIGLMNFLMWFGNTTILLMAGIQSIDEALFESARLDGSTSTQVFFNITMPLLMPIFIYVLITSMIGGIQMFDVPQVLTNGHGIPNNTSTTLIMYLNNFLGISKNYGMAGALSVLLFFITAVLSGIVFKTINRK